MSKKTKPQSDYILIAPDKPQGGAFDVGSNFIDETGTIVDCGPKVSKETAALKGKRVLFNAWACDQKTIGQERYYFAPESANCICATI